MKVKMLQGMAGPNINLRPGEQFEGTPEECRRLIEQGAATAIKQKKEKAVTKKPERAVINEA